MNYSKPCCVILVGALTFNSTLGIHENPHTDNRQESSTQIRIVALAQGTSGGTLVINTSTRS
jgi:hypothetical protein